MPYYVKTTHLINQTVEVETVKDPHTRKPLVFLDPQEAEAYAKQLEKSPLNDLGLSFYVSPWSEAQS